ncbi:hypothetical protein ATO7_06275 [Oceanococcus atlanticus]|uniref:site-specific DNA-methyltransferase (adenine-specific) n=1 Tax=Oceanococcus atlanticus TaxID=1317117 RepID=A0A1Y1SII0_9GAMM|nr:N-6 DNA methylase [Oceanococcus atlanticus]ORE89464.1 hypothetical protein ATO7_06275 [Oceanococcus atlanticus]
MNNLSLLLEILGYDTSRGWLPANEFDQIVGPVSALRRARDHMNVCGAFGTWQTLRRSDGQQRFTPFLFIAEAKDDDTAKTVVHRRVWSQGLAPFLIISTPKYVYISEGYHFSHSNWEQSVKRVQWEQLKSGVDSNDRKVLTRFAANRLLSSVAWRDFTINPSSRVDRRLLSTLEALSCHVTQQSGVSARSANTLIGRFLYFYILHDRALIDEGWLAKFGAESAFTQRNDNLNTKMAWEVFDELDKLLNGSIFPLTKGERSQFSDADVRLLRDCIKLGDEPYGSLRQLNFFDFDLSCLQTETLSAIYEQFLKTEDAEKKRTEGVFYTPPFLADFVLDRVEDAVELNDSKRIIDCTAGSGVFVVGAYRRIIESLLQKKRETYLSAAKLRDTLTGSVFAIEKNPSAHAVTSFSLYLTMLDYVAPRELNDCLHGQAEEPLFPHLAKHNIICSDFFTTSPPQNESQRFDIAIGNPPWQKLAEVTSAEGIKNTTRFEAQVDANEAAEHAVWLLLDKYLRKDGIAAQVVPTKSLVSPSAKRFPLQLAQKVEVIGVVNLTHLRYQLFKNARQAASVVILRNNEPAQSSTAWVLSPTRAHLPGPTDLGAPWMIPYDPSQIQKVHQRTLAKGGSSWFESIMLRPIDRHIRRYVADIVELNRVCSLKGFLEAHKLNLARGGSPAQTGLTAAAICGADKNSANDFRKFEGIHFISPLRQRTTIPELPYSGLASDWQKSINQAFIRRFSGHVLIIPRSLQGIAYVRAPLAFNSSLNALYFKKYPLTHEESGYQERVLTAIGRYLESDVAQYLIAITGRLWMLDRTRLEKNDLLNIPLPFKDIDDELINLLHDEDQDRLSMALLKRFGFSQSMTEVVLEYSKFRKSFEDGQVPVFFASSPTNQDFSAYKNALSRALRSLCDESIDIHISPINAETNTYRVSIQLDEKSDSRFFVSRQAGTADFFECSALEHNDAQTSVELVKPAEKFRWTIESAYTDGAKIIQTFLEE